METKTECPPASEIVKQNCKTLNTFNKGWFYFLHKIFTQFYIWKYSHMSGTAIKQEQAGAELGQAQLKLGFGFTSVYLYQIDKLGI